MAQMLLYTIPATLDFSIYQQYISPSLRPLHNTTLSSAKVFLEQLIMEAIFLMRSWTSVSHTESSPSVFPLLTESQGAGQQVEASLHCDDQYGLDLIPGVLLGSQHFLAFWRFLALPNLHASSSWFLWACGGSGTAEPQWGRCVAFVYSTQDGDLLSFTVPLYS